MRQIVPRVVLTPGFLLLPILSLFAGEKENQKSRIPAVATITVPQHSAVPGVLSPQANLTEDFSSPAFPPSGWVSYRGTNGVGTLYDWVRSASKFASSPASAFVRYENISPDAIAEDWLVTPALRPTPGNDTLKFKMAQDFTSDYGSVYTIRVSSSSQTDRNSFTIVRTYAETDFGTSFSNVAIPLTSYIGSDIYVAFVMAQDDGDNWYIDDVSGVSVPPSATPPNCATNVGPADGMDSVSILAGLNWSSGGGTPTGYKLYFGTNNPPGNIVNGSDLGNVTSYQPISALAYNTTYYWKVVPYNNQGDATGCAVWSFLTVPDPMVNSFPYVQTWQQSTYGWTAENTNSDPYTWAWYVDPSLATNLCVGVVYNANLAMDDWLFSPPLTLVGGHSYVVTFLYKARSATYPEQLEVKWGTSPTSGGMTSPQIFNNSNIINTTFSTGTGSFMPSTSGTYYVGWHGYSLPDKYYLFVDSCAIEDEGALPITLNFLNAHPVANTTAVLVQWGTLTETNNFGFEVQKREGTTGEYHTIPNSFVPGNGTSNVPHEYSFTDATITPGVWYYRLKQTDLDGSVTYTEGVEVTSPTDVSGTLPAEFALAQNFPNPFNPETEIRFTVETPGKATLRLYNVVGEEVGVLFDATAEPGRTYTARVNGSGLATGLYYYRLESGSHTAVRKMLLIK